MSDGRQQSFVPGRAGERSDMDFMLKHSPNVEEGLAYGARFCQIGEGGSSGVSRTSNVLLFSSFTRYSRAPRARVDRQTCVQVMRGDTRIPISVHVVMGTRLW